MNHPTLPALPPSINEPAALSPTFSTLEAAPHRHNQAAWMMIIPVLSTAHLPQSTFDRLEELAFSAHMGEINECGALLRVDGDDLDEYTGELLALMQYLADRNFQYVRLDPNGEVFADLPQYPWPGES